MELVHKLEDDMRHQRVKQLPATVTCEKVLPGSVADYQDTATQARCTQDLAAEVAVPPTSVRICGLRPAEGGAAGAHGGGRRHRGAGGGGQGGRGGTARVVLSYEVRLGVSESCQHLLHGLLVHEPRRRCSWQQLFEHPWLGLAAMTPVRVRRSTHQPSATAVAAAQSGAHALPHSRRSPESV
jgi:hypothetical protein